MQKRLVSMTLLKTVVLWDGSPPTSAGVPNLFGVSPQRRRFAGGKAPNKLGSPTIEAFFNRLFDTLLAIRSQLLDRRLTSDLRHLNGQLVLWDKAPKTCAAIVKALQKEPVTARLLHAQYAGLEAYFEDFPPDKEIPFENTALRMDENLFITNKHSGGVLAFYVNPEVRTFCML